MDHKPRKDPVPPSSIHVAERYGALELRIRRTIDARTRYVCQGCTRCCCRAHYCAETARNPWYVLVREVMGQFALPLDWRQRREPFGLGESGCEIRAGRYVFCYSYNCPQVIRSFQSAQARRYFQELSDLLLSPNRLAGGRLLHELRDLADLSTADLEQIACRIDAASARLDELEASLSPYMKAVLWAPDGGRLELEDGQEGSSSGNG